jgi:hypothetical protein
VTVGKDGSLNVAAGQDVSCTVTNTRNTGSLTLTKKVIWPDPVPADTGKFNLQINGATKLADATSGQSTTKVTVPTGANSVGETAGTGTTLADFTSSYSCSDSQGPVTVGKDGSLNVAAGQDVSCTVTNTRNTGTLKLTKTVVWPDPVPADTGKFNLQINGATKLADATSGQSTAVTTVPTGANSVGETAGTGTTLADFTSSYSCSDSEGPVTVGKDGSVNVAAGQDVSCTVTNTRNTGTVIVAKKITGPDDGTSRFDLQIDGISRTPLTLGDGGKTDPVTLVTGTHTIGEVAGNSSTHVADFTQSFSCSDKNGDVPIGKDGVFKLDSAQDVTCTITNDRKAGSLTLTKKVIWPEPVPADTGKFNLQINGVTKLADATSGQSTDKTTVASGANSVGETAGTGTSLADFTSAYSCSDSEGPVTVGKDGSVNVASGQDVSCTVTNTRNTGTLKVTKKVVWPDPVPADTGKFNLQINGVTKLADATSGQSTAVTTVPTGSNSVGETAGTSTDLGAYSATTACSDASGDVPVTDGSFNVASGSDVTCTITNTLKTGRLTIVKNVSGGSTQAFPFTGPLGPFTLTNQQSQSWDLAPGKWSVTEGATSGFDLTGLSCSNEGEGGPAVIDGSKVTVDLAAGEDITCTYINAPGGILPARSGTARLSGTTGCAVGTYATERVAGTLIAKVVWFVNGKRRSTLTKPNSGSFWQLRYPVNALNFGHYAVRAEVRFRTRVTPRYRLLRTAFSRCLPPRATG